jgi:subtilase family serine protease
VTNQGDEKAEGSEVTLNIAGHSLKGSAKQLNPGESTSVTFTYTFRDSETYTVTATVDPSNAIPESNEGNNQKSIRVQVKTKLPDLTIPEIRIAPQEIHIGDQVTFRVAVKNEGKGKAEKFTVKLEIAAEMTTSPTELESDVMNLNAGESSYVYFTHTFSHKGSYEILATADPRNAVSESEENNNTKQLTVTVEPGSLPDLMVSYVKVYYSYRESGGEEELYLTEVDFTVKNIGNGDCLGNIKVRIWLDSPSNVIYEDIVYTSPLPSMQQFTETIAFYDGWLVDPDTTHNVGVFVDSLNTITESNENNNTLEITFPEGHSILFLGYNMCCSVRIDIQERQFIPKELLF